MKAIQAKIQTWKKRLKKLKESPDFRKLELSIVSRDPLYWLENYAITQDEHDESIPFKPFPEYEIWKTLKNLWFTKHILLVSKSRQIMVSWFCVAMILWEVLYRNGRRMCVLSKRGEDANALINRMVHILSFLPREITPNWNLRKGQNYCLIIPDKKNTVMAYPSGPDKVRSQTFSRIFADEMAFQDKAQEIYKAATPTIRGGGFLVGVSSANSGSFFKQLIDMATQEFVAQAPQELQVFPQNFQEARALADSMGPRQPQGTALFDSKVKGICVLWLHYTAHEDKRSEEWLKHAQRGMEPNAWLQEMEIDFRVSVGQKVFYVPPYCIVDEIRLLPNRIWVRALDFGYQAPTACLWAQYDTKMGELYVYREYYVAGQSVSQHKKNLAKIQLQDWHVLGIEPYDGMYSDEIYDISLIDPQAKAKTVNTEWGLCSLIELYAAESVEKIEGIEVNISQTFVPAGKKPVDAIHKLQDMFKQGTVKISQQCKNLLFELDNFVDNEDRLERGLKPNNKHDHLVDCLLFIVQALPVFSQGYSPPPKTITEVGKHVKQTAEKLQLDDEEIF